MVLPAAGARVGAGVVTALARVLGATAPLLLLGAGGSYGTLSYRVYRLSSDPTGFAAALVLLLAVGALALAGDRLMEAS